MNKICSDPAVGTRFQRIGCGLDVAACQVSDPSRCWGGLPFCNNLRLADTVAKRPGFCTLTQCIRVGCRSTCSASFLNAQLFNLTGVAHAGKCRGERQVWLPKLTPTWTPFGANGGCFMFMPRHTSEMNHDLQDKLPTQHLYRRDSCMLLPLAVIDLMGHCVVLQGGCGEGGKSVKPLFKQAVSVAEREGGF